MESPTCQGDRNLRSEGVPVSSLGLLLDCSGSGTRGKADGEGWANWGGAVFSTGAGPNRLRVPNGTGKIIKVYII